jgi:hypothetical protein
VLTNRSATPTVPCWVVFIAVDATSSIDCFRALPVPTILCLAYHSGMIMIIIMIIIIAVLRFAVARRSC